MNGQFKVTCTMLHKFSHSLMVHVRVLGSYIHFALMYTVDNIFLVLPIKDLMSEDSGQTTPFKLVTGLEPPIWYLGVLFCRCVVVKATSHVGKNALNMRHQAQNCFSSIFVGIILHQKWYLVNIPHKQKIVSSYNFVFDKNLSS